MFFCLFVCLFVFFFFFLLLEDRFLVCLFSVGDNNREMSFSQLLDLSLPCVEICSAGSVCAAKVLVLSNFFMKLGI